MNFDGTFLIVFGGKISGKFLVNIFEFDFYVEGFTEVKLMVTPTRDLYLMLYYLPKHRHKAMIVGMLHQIALYCMVLRGNSCTNIA